MAKDVVTELSPHGGPIETSDHKCDRGRDSVTIHPDQQLVFNLGIGSSTITLAPWW
jgi:hypothetical protein